jgi:hypothetical protein
MQHESTFFEYAPEEMLVPLPRGPRSGRRILYLNEENVLRGFFAKTAQFVRAIFYAAMAYAIFHGIADVTVLNLLVVMKAFGGIGGAFIISILMSRAAARHRKRRFFSFALQVAAIGLFVETAIVASYVIGRAAN